MTSKTIKLTAGLGALILLITSGFHMTGYVPAKQALLGIKPDFFKNALTGSWITPSVHWLFIACMTVGLSFYRSNACAAVLIGFGILILLDALIILTHVGLFAGAFMLAASGTLILIAGLMLRREMKAST